MQSVFLIKRSRHFFERISLTEISFSYLLKQVPRAEAERDDETDDVIWGELVVDDVTARRPVAPGEVDVVRHVGHRDWHQECNDGAAGDMLSLDTANKYNCSKSF